MSKAEASDESIRRCILSGERHERTGLIRLAVGPDGEVVADLGNKLGGRGAWIGPDRPALETALAKGRLRGQLARTLKVDAGALKLADDLPDRIAAGLAQRTLNRLGLENRAGNLTFGFDRVQEAIRAGRVFGLLHAADAAADGAGKLDGGVRTWCPDAWVMTLPVTRADLGLALGRDNMVHAAVIDSGASRRVAEDVRRWAAFVATPATGD
ncbi:DUF448 domain-containing protein [Parapedomonas caeni]